MSDQPSEPCFVTLPHDVTSEQLSPLTRKSTPIVAVASSSGIHASSENRSNRLLFPTDALPIRRSLTFTGVEALEPDNVVLVSMDGISSWRILP